MARFVLHFGEDLDFDPAETCQIEAPVYVRPGPDPNHTNGALLGVQVSLVFDDAHLGPDLNDINKAIHAHGFPVGIG